VRLVADRERESMSVIHVTNELRTVMRTFAEEQMEQRSEGGSMDNRTTRRPSRWNGRASWKRKGSELQHMKEEDLPAMSRKTFDKFMSYPAVITLLRDCGVDAIGILDAADFIFSDKVKDDSEGLSFVDFVEIVLNMRGTNVATLKDTREQVRQMRVACQDIGRHTGNAVVTYLGQFQADIMRQLHDIKTRIQNIESDSDDEDEILSPYMGRVGTTPGGLMPLPFLGLGSQPLNADFGTQSASSLGGGTMDFSQSTSSNDFTLGSQGTQPLQQTPYGEYKSLHRSMSELEETSEAEEITPITPIMPARTRGFFEET